MKVLLVNGSPHERGCTFTALSEVAKTLQENGVETEIFHVGNHPVRGCIACGRCAALGRCVFEDDAANQLQSLMKSADGVVIGSPVYYAGPNGALCALLDRVFYSSGGAFANKPAAAVVSARRSGTTAAFDRLNKYFTITNMPIASSQYWNSIHGRAPGEADQDEEGKQTMRTLARNMTFLMRSIALGKEAYGLPQPEPRVATHFIR